MSEALLATATLKLDDQLFDRIEGYQKTATIRRGQKCIRLGPMVLVPWKGVCRPSLLVDVTRITYVKVRNLTDEDARRDGYLSMTELYCALRKYYPLLREDDIMTIIAFNFIRREPN